MIVLTIIVPLLFLTLLILYLSSNWRYFKACFEIPGPKFLPIVGNLPQLLRMKKRDMVKILKELGEKPDNLFRLWLGPKFSVIVSSPDDCKAVLKNCLNRSDVYDAILGFFGTGLFNLRDAEWKARRKLLNPTLNVLRLNSFANIFNESAFEIVGEIEEHKGPIAILDMVQRHLMDNILQTSIGVNGKNEFGAKLLANFNKFFNYSDKLQLNPFRKMNPFYAKTKFFQDYNELCMDTDIVIRKIISIRLAINEAEGESKIFVDQLLQEMKKNQNLSIEDIVNETKTLIIAGYETTASTIVTVMLMLAQNPQIQQQVYDEIMEFAPAGHLTMDQCNKLQVLDRVLKETLRLFPTVALLTRVADQPINLSGRKIPRGTQLMVSLFSMQRSEKFWGPTANSFDPLRWLPENLHKDPSKMFLSFGGDPRNCIGMKYATFTIKVIVAIVVRNFRLSSMIRFEDIELTFSTLLRFENELLVSFTGRKPNF